MRILDRSVFVGPSLYAHFPVIRLELDLERLEAWPTGKLGPAFVDALIEAVPGLDVDIPLVVMTYYNLVHHDGHRRFAHRMVEAGISGCIGSL